MNPNIDSLGHSGLGPPKGGSGWKRANPPKSLFRTLAAGRAVESRNPAQAAGSSEPLDRSVVHASGFMPSKLESEVSIETLRTPIENTG